MSIIKYIPDPESEANMMGHDRLKTRICFLCRALEPFARAYVVSMAPFGLDLNSGASRYLPTAWPTVDDFKDAHEILKRYNWELS